MFVCLFVCLVSSSDLSVCCYMKCLRCKSQKSRFLRVRGGETGNVLKFAVTRMKYFCAKDGTEKKEYFSHKMKITCRGMDLTVPERNFQLPSGFIILLTRESKE